MSFIQKNHLNIQHMSLNTNCNRGVTNKFYKTHRYCKAANTADYSQDHITLHIAVIRVKLHNFIPTQIQVQLILLRVTEEPIEVRENFWWPVTSKLSDGMFRIFFSLFKVLQNASSSFHLVYPVPCLFDKKKELSSRPVTEVRNI